MRSFRLNLRTNVAIPITNPFSLSSIPFQPDFTNNFRPVVALIEIEIQSLDKEKEAAVHDDVMRSMGPADPTVIISSLNSGDEINTEALLSELEGIGNTVLVR